MFSTNRGRFYEDANKRRSIPRSPEQICHYRIRKKMDQHSKFVISASGRTEQRRNPKIRFVRIRELQLSRFCVSGRESVWRPAKVTSKSRIVRLFFGYLILLPSFTSRQRCLAHCGSNCGCCDKLSWKLSGLICKSVKACNSLDD